MMRGFPDVHFRLIIEPVGELKSSGALPINATEEDMKREIEKGISDGAKAVRDLEASGWITNSEIATKIYKQYKAESYE